MAGRDVSIVLSTHNRADQLGRALARLVRQAAGHVSYEILVVDNNSTDHTQDVVRAYASAHPQLVRSLFEPRQGVSFGRNTGIESVRSPLVAFTDDDVCAQEDWVAEMVRLAQAHPHAGCFGGPILPLWPSAPPRWLDERHWSPVALTDHGAQPFEVSARNPKCLISANLVVRRDVFDRVGLFSPAYPRSQDHEWELRFWEAGGVGLYAPSLVVRAAVDPHRMTRRYHWRWHRTHARACARMRLRERVGPEGALRAPVPGPRLFGAPRFVFRQALADAARCVGHAALDPLGSHTFHYANAVRHLVAYVAESRRLHRAAEQAGWTGTDELLDYRGSSS